MRPLAMAFGFVLVALTSQPHLLANNTAPQTKLDNLSIESVNSEEARFVQTQIDNLSDPSFRARQLARWRLTTRPLAAIEQIEKSILTLDHNAASQLIDLLSSMAIHSDVAVSVNAQSTLKKLANDVSSTGRLANNTLLAIADLQEEKAIEILTGHGAYVGPQRFGVNGRIRGENLLSLSINEQFDGDSNVIQWIRFLKSVESVYLEGPQIDTRFFQALSELSNLKVLKLKHVSMQRNDLKSFSSMMKLEHLGLNYVQIDDSYIPELLQLPVTQTLRLYGTKITDIGAEKLTKQLDGIEIFVGRGGFLGIGTRSPLNTIVGTVTPDSAATEAGIRTNDEILKIDGKEVSTFDEIRSELGNFEAGEEVAILIRRFGPNGLEELTINATLREDAT